MGVIATSIVETMVSLGSDPSAWRHFSVNGHTLQLWQEDGRGQRLGTLTSREFVRFRTTSHGAKRT